MPSRWLTFNGIEYSISDIKQGTLPNFDASEYAPVQFCRDWINGKEEFVLSTSGSTGSPKKIFATRQQLKASAQLTASYLNLKKEYTSLVCLDTRYIAGIMMLVRSMETGMNMYVVEPTANPFEKIPKNVSIDFAALVPYQLEAILQSEHKRRLNALKIVIIGGAPVSDNLRKSLAELDCSFYSTYGMTETLSHIALQKLNGTDVQNFFQVLPGISLRTDERGCLVIHAPHINPEPIITNDLVELLAADKFRWLGRVDNVINSGGVKVIPEKIESMIEPMMSSLGLSNRFFIGGLPDAALGQKVILLLEGEKLSSSQEENLRQQLKVSLSRYEIPKSIHYIPIFIQTDTGKINKPKTLELIR